MKTPYSRTTKAINTKWCRFILFLSED